MGTQKMSFLPGLRIFLLRKGTIYTVRKYKMAERFVNVEGVGRCKRTPLGLVYKKNLPPYVALSGFSSVDSWWAKIQCFIPGLFAPRYLYKVTKEK